MLKIFQNFLLYRKLEFRYSSANAKMISSGRNTDDKMIKLLWKNPDNFLFNILGPHTCLHFMLHALQSILSELYIPPLFYVKHSIFSESRCPLFIRSITTPPNHNFLKNSISSDVLESSPNFFGAANQPYPKPPPLPSCMPSTLAAPSHDRFYFLNSLYLYRQ